MKKVLIDFFFFEKLYRKNIYWNWKVFKDWKMHHYHGNENRNQIDEISTYQDVSGDFIQLMKNDHWIPYQEIRTKQYHNLS